jgi:hypothetical protein
VVSVGVLPLLLSLSMVTQTTRTIERAFFQDDAKILVSLLTVRNHVNISLPEPISFSDQLSREQAYFLFRRISSEFATFEFYADPSLPLLLKGDSFIFKARWSFRNKKNNNQYVFQIFFYLIKENSPGHAGPPGSWKIMEIKAENL